MNKHTHCISSLSFLIILPPPGSVSVCTATSHVYPSHLFIYECLKMFRLIGLYIINGSARFYLLEDKEGGESA